MNQQHRPEIDGGTVRFLLGGRWAARGSPGLADRGGGSDLFGRGLMRGRGGDRRAQAGIGRKHAEIAVAVNPRGWNERAEALKELQPRQHQFRTAIGPGFGQAV